MDESKYKQKESDLVKEFIYAFLGVIIVIILFAIFFKSPQMKPYSIKQFANQNPVEFAQVEMRNILGLSAIATYGPPYNNSSQGQVQSIGFISPEGIEGVDVPVNSIKTFVENPLKIESKVDPSLSKIMNQYFYLKKNNSSLLTKMENNYYNALNNAKYRRGKIVVKKGVYGPIPQMITYLLRMGKSGILENVLNNNLPGNNSTYTYNYQNSLLFLQGTPLRNVANKYSMLGNQWGILKEEGNYPGPWWLGIYTFLYQIPPYSTTASGDLMAFATFGLVMTLLIFAPFIPIINKIPYYIPLYKVIWKRYYERE